MSPHPDVAFKILTGEEWAEFQASGRFEGSPADRADGFIHLSAADQVAGTLARHYAARRDVVVAEIELAGLGAAVRWEVSRGGALFPHLYGALPLGAVRSARDGALESPPRSRHLTGADRAPLAVASATVMSDRIEQARCRWGGPPSATRACSP